MTDCFIYDAVRTPRGRGKKDGALHEVTALGLATHVLNSIRERNGLDTALVEDVVMGCVSPVNEQGSNIARTAVLNAGYAQTTPGVQINRFCASGLEATNMAAAQVMAGQAKLTIGGGVESMSRVPIGADKGALMTDPEPAFKSYFVPQGISADLIATKYGFSRDDVDAYAVESQKRAAEAWAEGLLQEIGGAGEGHQRASDPRQGRAYAARDDHAVACEPEAVLRGNGRVRLRRRHHSALSGDRNRQSRAHGGQLVGHCRWRSRHPARQQGGRAARKT